MSQLLDVDERRRTTLSKLGHHRQYLGEELPDGTVVLHPAIVMSEVQARLLAAPALLAQLTEANGLQGTALLRRPRRQRRESGEPASTE
jgi:hypothetical protein